jgi:hypothetical protein
MSTLLPMAKTKYRSRPRFVTKPMGISTTSTAMRAMRIPARERFRRAVSELGSTRAAWAKTRVPSP